MEQIEKEIKEFCEGLYELMFIKNPKQMTKDEHKIYILALRKTLGYFKIHNQ